jgi:hypothetical protein
VRDGLSWGVRGEGKGSKFTVGWFDLLESVLGTGYENTGHTLGNDEPGTAPYKFVGYFTRPTVF